ncbi:MAG: chemotaxis protein CheW [Propionivibrio sp.]
MGKRGSLREFQAHLAKRLAGASEQSAAGLLGIQAGADFWLLDLTDAGEVIPLPPLTSVPLTKVWFVGIANIRGNLHAVADFSAFQGREATPQNSSARLLLIGARHGNNAALLVTRTLGLRNVDNLTPAAADSDAPSWASAAYTDNEGRRWKMLDVRRLLADNDFMEIGA